MPGCLQLRFSPGAERIRWNPHASANPGDRNFTRGDELVELASTDSHGFSGFSRAKQDAIHVALSHVPLFGTAEHPRVEV
jgi:hypothetical protein